MKLPSLVIAMGFLGIFGGCVQSTDDIRAEQDEAWVTQVAAVTQDIGPAQARTTRQLKSGFSNGNVTEITQAFAEYDRFVRSLQERVNRIKPPPQCADEQEVLTQFIATVRGTNARLSDPTLEMSDLPAIFESLDPEVRQAESSLRQVLRKSRC